jgi:hypothetical protein
MSEGRSLMFGEEPVKFSKDFNNFGFSLIFDRDHDYELRNEITVQIAFWTLCLRFNLSFWKPKKIRFKDNYGNSETIEFKKDFYWIKYFSFIALSAILGLCIRYYFTK